MLFGQFEITKQWKQWLKIWGNEKKVDLKWLLISLSHILSYLTLTTGTNCLVFMNFLTNTSLKSSLEQNGSISQLVISWSFEKLSFKKIKYSLGNSFFNFGSTIVQHIIAFPMVSGTVSVMANLFYYCYHNR